MTDRDTALREALNVWAAEAASSRRLQADDDGRGLALEAAVWGARAEGIEDVVADLRDALAQPAEPGLTEAWARAEAAVPEDWELSLGVGSHGRDDLYTATASYRYSLRYYRENVGRARFAPFEMEHADTPAAALLALAEKLEANHD